MIMIIMKQCIREPQKIVRKACYRFFIICTPSKNDWETVLRYLCAWARDTLYKHVNAIKKTIQQWWRRRQRKKFLHGNCVCVCVRDVENPHMYADTHGLHAIHDSLLLRLIERVNENRTVNVNEWMKSIRWGIKWLFIANRRIYKYSGVIFACYFLRVHSLYLFLPLCVCVPPSHILHSNKTMLRIFSLCLFSFSHFRDRLTALAFYILPKKNNNNRNTKPKNQYDNTQNHKVVTHTYSRSHQFVMCQYYVAHLIMYCTVCRVLYVYLFIFLLVLCLHSCRLIWPLVLCVCDKFSMCVIFVTKDDFSFGSGNVWRRWVVTVFVWRIGAVCSYLWSDMAGRMVEFVMRFSI